MESTIFSLLPPIIAIALALLTKEVYLSLMIGILAGALLYNGLDPLAAMETTFDIMGVKIGSNVDILIFLVLLGILVALITRSGASRAYGDWAIRSIKTKRGSLLATSCLGALIFVDDYFNCLTVGTVMRPVTDRYKVSRAKLAYIIDATAAPVCIIAPISSWAAAVGSSLPEGSTIDGFSLFMKSIPFNFYAFFTIIFMLFIILKDIDYSKMAKYRSSDTTIAQSASSVDDAMLRIGNGRVLDLLLPIFVLILSCIIAMLYTGGFFSGASVKDAFSDCSSARSLVLGSFFTLIFTFVLYIPRKVISFTEFCECFSQGFKAMTGAILILCLAWSLSGICGSEYLNIGGFVSSIVDNSVAIGRFLPGLFFVVSLGLSFATGTSWGTFGILIPIAVAVFGNDSNMLVISVASILSGAVCGDHISPISDTTILASTGADCPHLDHVTTQLPYALTVAISCLIGHIVAGVLQNGWIGAIIGLISLIITMLYIVHSTTKTKNS